MFDSGPTMLSVFISLVQSDREMVRGRMPVGRFI